MLRFSQVFDGLSELMLGFHWFFLAVLILCVAPAGRRQTSILPSQVDAMLHFGGCFLLGLPELYFALTAVFGSVFPS